MESRFAGVPGHAFLVVLESSSIVASQADNKKAHKAAINSCLIVITFPFYLTVKNILGSKKHSCNRAIKDIQIVDLIKLKHRHTCCSL